MFRLLEALVDPFQPYDAQLPPPSGVWPFIVRHLRPLRHVILVSVLFAVVSAAAEIWLIGYAGRLVDVLAATAPDELWSALGTELLVAAAIILIGRPLAKGIREGLNDIAFRPNAESMIGWRAHRHVLQPVGGLVPQRPRRTHRHTGPAGGRRGHRRDLFRAAHPDVRRDLYRWLDLADGNDRFAADRAAADLGRALLHADGLYRAALSGGIGALPEGAIGPDRTCWSTVTATSTP